MTSSPDQRLALVLEFYEGVLRKAPGSEASTLAVLARLEGLPEEARIADLGCGAGVASLALARQRPGLITAVDIHRPFLDQLTTLAARQGLENRISAVQADMAALPFADGAFDVVWSEGAIYNLGFEAGLRQWRRLLRPGGYVVVSEVAWLTTSPPRRAQEFWEAEYPAIGTIEAHLGKLRAAGYESWGHFVLPPHDWENYYLPLEQRLEVFAGEHAEPEAAEVVAELRREIALWRECGSSYGYVFYLGRAH